MYSSLFVWQLIGNIIFERLRNLDNRFKYSYFITFASIILIMNSRYLAICHPIFFQNVRSRSSPWFEVFIAILSGMIIQLPHMVRTQVTDPTCWAPDMDIPNYINLTVFCPCNFDENDVLPSCVESQDCPFIILGNSFILFYR